jgi:peptidoglycan hydrolase CwlO-like protein
MPDKTQELENLVEQVLSRQKTLQAQNKKLAGRIRVLEETADQLKQTETELKNLREWKKNAQNVLRRLSGKIDKEIQKHQKQQDKIA